MGFFRRRPVEAPTDLPQLVLPRASIDGWTLAGTPLAAKLSAPDRRELETLLHAVAVSSDSPWTYERAAVLLEKADESGQALVVCERWLAHPASRWPVHAHATRSVQRRRQRLRERLHGAAVAG